MIQQNIVTLGPGDDFIQKYKVDFQQGAIVASIIPVSDDEQTQVKASYAAKLMWSNNDKFYVKEPICDLKRTKSSGESLVTSTQAVYSAISVHNYEAIPQKYYISLYVPGTAT